MEKPIRMKVFFILKQIFSELNLYYLVEKEDIAAFLNVEVQLMIAIGRKRISACLPFRKILLTYYSQKCGLKLFHHSEEKVIVIPLTLMKQPKFASFISR